MNHFLMFLLDVIINSTWPLKCFTVFTLFAISFKGKVIQTKNTSTLSFPLSFMVILVSASWFFYGAILGDYFVMVRYNFVFLNFFKAFNLFLLPSSLCVTSKSPLVRKAMGNQLINSTSLDKTESPVSGSCYT